MTITTAEIMRLWRGGKNTKEICDLLKSRGFAQATESIIYGVVCYNVAVGRGKASPWVIAPEKQS